MSLGPGPGSSSLPRGEHLVLRPAPFLGRTLTTPRLMGDVIIALVPVVAAGVWYFGLGALLVLAAATAGAAATEAVLGSARGAVSLRDGSALLTGLLLGLTLPPGLPLWMAFLGGVVAVGLGKTVWGGLGHNLFNPALVGRAFLQAAFPTALTTWSIPGGAAELGTLRGPIFAWPFLHGEAVDAVTTATPLALQKFQDTGTELALLLSGHIGGCIGETSAAAVILGGLFLLARRAFEWRIPAGTLLSVAVFSGILHAIDPGLPTPSFMLLSGGLLFGAVYMATDPVTSPLAPRGAWIFGAGIGVLVVVIRLWGGLPEGVMYAILLMNSAVPHIERWSQPRPFGREKRA